MTPFASSLPWISFCLWLYIPPTWAAELLTGDGPYDKGSLTGPASEAVKKWLHDETVECYLGGRERNEEARCTLSLVTNSLAIFHVGPPQAPEDYAIAFAQYFPDSGNAGPVLMGVWRRGSDGTYRFVGKMNGRSGATNVRFADGMISYDVPALRQGDPRCCPTGTTVVHVTVTDRGLRQTAIGRTAL